MNISKISLSTLMTGVVLFTHPSFGVGPGGVGGGGSTQITGYANEHGLRGVDKSGAETTAEVCSSFARAAAEGLHLLDLLIFADTKTAAHHLDSIFPEFKVESESATDRVLVLIDRPGLWIRQSELRTLGQRMDHLCEGQWITFETKVGLKDRAGEPVIALNQDGSRPIITVDPNEWQSRAILSRTECAGDAGRCVDIFRRSIATHEILSLWTHQRIEGDRAYPLTASLLRFGGDCNNGMDPHQDFYFRLVGPAIAELPTAIGSRWAMPSEVWFTGKRADLVKSNQAFVQRISGCDPSVLSPKPSLTSGGE